MKLIIAGSRTIDKYRAFFEMTKFSLSNSELMQEVEEFVTGCCTRGADQVPFLGEELTEVIEDEDGFLPITEFPADWDTHGKKAGFLRNIEMADYADTLLLIWDGKSKGSAHMKKEMITRKKKVYEVIV